MADYVTLDVAGDAGGVETVKSRAKDIEFADGTVQSVFIGRRRSTRSNEFARTLDEPDASALYSKLQAYLDDGTIFWYAMTPTMPKRLYKVGKEALSFTHVGGLAFKVSATFEEWRGGAQ